MKKIYLMLMLLMVGVAANAQRNLKLQVDIVKPSLDTNIVTGSTTFPVYVITNTATAAKDSIAAGDTIWLRTPLNTTTGLSGIIPGSSIKVGQSFTISNATITGGYSVKFDSIKTLTNATTAYVNKPFTANTQYWWYVLIDTVLAKSTNPAIATVATDYDTQRVWINKSSGLVEFANTQVETIKTYPNPAVNQLSFEYSFTNQENATARILDVTGRTVFVKEFENNTGNQKFDLDINNLNTGSYLLQFIVGDKTMTNKFNVQK